MIEAGTSGLKMDGQQEKQMFPEGATKKFQPVLDHPQLSILPQNNHLLSLMTMLRDVNTTTTEFARATERIGNQLITAGVYISMSIFRVLEQLP